MNASWTLAVSSASSFLLALAAVLIATEPVWANSELMLPYPASYGKIPAATFDAPQTIWSSSPSPTSTRHRLRRSAPRCCSHSTT